jgi:hypothetical protein
MMNPGSTISRWGSFEKDEIRGILSYLDALMKNIFFIPELEYSFLHVGIIKIFFDLFEHFLNNLNILYGFSISPPLAES